MMMGMVGFDDGIMEKKGMNLVIPSIVMVMMPVMCSNLSKTSDTNCRLISCMSCVAAHFLQTEH